MAEPEQRMSGVRDERFVNLPAQLVILGFTGPIGAGCSFFARRIAEREGYLYLKLSDPLHAEAKRRRLPETVENLQTIGNEIRRETGDPGYLARSAIFEADRRQRKADLAGLVLDGIKNLGEVEVLQRFPNFFLFAVHASEEVRSKRFSDEARGNRDDFAQADRRDRDEQEPSGQQVKLCTDRADILCNNDESVSLQAPTKLEEYVADSVVARYIHVIKALAGKEERRDRRPEVEEVCMTAAYCVARQSLCVKRQVGAVIAGPDGGFLASGHNAVPPGHKDCIEDPDLQCCARDRLQEDFVAKLRHCPMCGAKLMHRTVCPKCAHEEQRFVKRCPGCGAEIDAPFACPECNEDVFRGVVPGADSRYGKLLDMCRALHGEENAILSLARNGIRLPPGCTLYTTTFPCTLCANKIRQLGIKRVVYAEPYPQKEAQDILEKGGDKGDKVDVVKFQGVKSSAFFRLYR